MRTRFHRIRRDLLKLRNLVAYAAVVVASVLAVLSSAGDVVPVDLKWAALLAAIAILVHRTTVPARWGTRFEDIAADRSASVVVEFHGFHNKTTHSRMHLERTPGVSDHWYSYWRSQFDHIWEAAERPPASGTALDSPGRGRPEA